MDKSYWITRDGKVEWVHIRECKDVSLKDCLVVLLFLVVLWYAFAFYAFSIPSDAELNSDSERRRAVLKAEEYVKVALGKQWENLGFRAFGDDQKEKAYTTNLSFDSDMNLSTKYFKGGVYQVYIRANTRFSSPTLELEYGYMKKINRLFARQEFIVTLSKKPSRNIYGTIDDNWKLVEIQTVKSNPNIEEIKDTVSTWKVPAPKGPNW